MRRQLRLAVIGFVVTFVAFFYFAAVATLVIPVHWNEVLAWALMFAPLGALLATGYPE